MQGRWRKRPKTLRGRATERHRRAGGRVDASALLGKCFVVRRGLIEAPKRSGARIHHCFRMRNVRRKNVSRALPERRRAHYTPSMKLAEKGRYAPPPNLPKHAQAVSRALATWPDVHARTHWLLGDETKVDGADFYVGELELGHIHLQGEAHIAVPAAVRNALIKSGVAAPFRWSESFVVFEIASSADVELAQSLFRLAYDRLKGASSAELVARCATLARERSALMIGHI